ncbi:MAG: hypothetical protein J7623_12870 [Chitinophaga sp.]|uniref:hypothetical protein n=1 Tax=Chitinophaga sp. TaxID=1869181 RepID=UPI001B10187B|nr:hypothetical protein [Chitinophaga sp.]MBO9729522.1 hypothetical protein [Chitinophaga sp.]
MMKVSQKLYNEKLRSPGERLARLAGTLAFMILVLVIAGFLVPRKFNDGAVTWIIFGLIALYFLVDTIYKKVLVSIHFDYELETVIITSNNLFSKPQTVQIPFWELRFKTGKEGKRFIPYLDIYQGKTKVIRLNRDSIGEHTFDMISEELTGLAL